MKCEEFLDSSRYWVLATLSIFLIADVFQGIAVFSNNWITVECKDDYQEYTLGMWSGCTRDYGPGGDNRWVCSSFPMNSTELPDWWRTQAMVLPITAVLSLLLTIMLLFTAFSPYEVYSKLAVAYAGCSFSLAACGLASVFQGTSAREVVKEVHTGVVCDPDRDDDMTYGGGFALTCCYCFFMVIAGGICSGEALVFRKDIENEKHDYGTVKRTETAGQVAIQKYPTDWQGYKFSRDYAKLHPALMDGVSGYSDPIERPTSTPSDHGLPPLVEEKQPSITDSSDIDDLLKSPTEREAPNDMSSDVTINLETQDQYERGATIP